MEHWVSALCSILYLECFSRSMLLKWFQSMKSFNTSGIQICALNRMRNGQNKLTKKEKCGTWRSKLNYFWNAFAIIAWLTLQCIPLDCGHRIYFVVNWTEAFTRQRLRTSSWSNILCHTLALTLYISSKIVIWNDIIRAIRNKPFQILIS